MIHAIIIDDEIAGREVLANYISKYCKDIRIGATASGVNEGVELIIESNPELVFLDVEMKDGTGFDLLNQIGIIKFKVIFVTAYENYAVKAFKYSASDYLLKPVNITELIAAVEKVKDEINVKTETQNTKLLMDIINNQEKEINSIVITDSKGFKILQIKDIIMIKADGSCTHFYLSENKIVSSSKNLGFYNYLLEGKSFIRTHKSFFVNHTHIKEFINSEQTILLKENLAAPLGDTYHKQFTQRFLKK
ncbi:MAG: LytTR family DNA-binding domain-containing protein [Bacteroidota bacterium]